MYEEYFDKLKKAFQIRNRKESSLEAYKQSIAKFLDTTGKNHWDHWTILSQRSLDLLTEYWRSYPVQREYLFVDLREPHAPLTKSGVETMIKKVGKGHNYVKNTTL